MALEHPFTSLKEGKSNYPRLSQGRSPTESLLSTHMVSGMASGLGDEPTLCKALQIEHILWNQQSSNTQWWSTTDDKARHQVALAQTFELMAWLGWLQSTETFLIRMKDVDTTEPEHGPTLGLEKGTGCICLRLKESTKSNCAKTANVVLAVLSASGLQSGIWWNQLRASPYFNNDFKALLFTSPD
eukprot:7492061-Ditylum_brightwellii.AAC.1